MKRMPDQIKDLVEHVRQMRQRVLGDENDILTIVLRGHLEVEEWLHEALFVSFPSSRYLADAQLRFYQKVHLVRALNIRHTEEPLWSGLGALNSLRNDLAHRLTSGQRESRVAAFIERISAESPEMAEHLNEVGDSVQERLLACFAYLNGALHSVIEEYEARARVAEGPVRAMLQSQYGWADGSEDPH